MRFNTKKIIGTALIGLGIITILMFLPYWIWCLVLGILIATLGCLMIKSC